MSEFRSGQATDIGTVRQLNQDRFFSDGSVFAVADGMGGHSGGEVASGLAVEALSHRQRLGSLADLAGLIHEANEWIVDKAREDPSLRGMGTTISVLAALDDVAGEKRLGIANVGDSRIYLFDDGELMQLTEDHSLVEALVRDGRLSPEEAGRHPQRNILTRALGIDDKALVDTWELRTVTGDRYLLCSDGLFNELTLDQITEIVAGSEDPQAAADVLVQRACNAGGRDNVTAVVVDVESGADSTDEPRVVAVRRAVPGEETFTSHEVDGDPDDDPSADQTDGTESESGDDSTDQTDGTESESGDTSADQADGTESESGDDSTEKAGRRVLDWRLGLLVVAVVIVIVLIVTAVAAYARSAYFVGLEGDDVVIYQGRPGGVLWFDPTVEEPVNVGLVELGDSDLDAVATGVEFDGIGDAREYGRELALRVRAGS